MRPGIERASSWNLCWVLNLLNHKGTPHLGLHCYLITYYLPIFSSFLRGRYADFITAYACKTKLFASALGFKISALWKYAVLLPSIPFSSFLHVFLSQLGILISLCMCFWNSFVQIQAHGDIYSYVFPLFNAQDDILNLSFSPLTLHLPDPFISEQRDLPYLFYSSTVFHFVDISVLFNYFNICRYKLPVTVN